MYLINQIKKDLAKKVKFGESLNYISFLKLYEPYKKWVPEGIFLTEVMNFNPAIISNFKLGKNYTIPPFFEFDEHIAETIREEMEEKFQNAELDYETFKHIYEEYESMIKEQDFAKIIFNINNSMFHKFKKGLQRARVFKKEENLFLQYYNRLYDQLYPLYSGQKINYQKFVQLHEQYAPFLNESDFAYCLGVDYCVLKEREIYLFRHAKIEYPKEDIKKLHQIYRNKKINYYQFQEIFLQYGNGLKEKEFARILGIPFPTFGSFKYKKTVNLIICKRALSKEEKKYILLECRREGLSRRPINYQEFLKYYEPYKNFVSPTDFAYIIGIKERSIQTLKEGGNVLALDFIKSEAVNMISQELLSYHYCLISYQKFLELYAKYRDYLSEVEFFYLLGLPRERYYIIKKYKEKETRLDFFKTERKIIKHQLKESKLYTWEDFESLGRMVELEIEKILALYFGEDKVDVVQRYFYALKTNRKLYIGNLPLKDTSLAEEIIIFCQKSAKIVCVGLECPHLIDDIAGEAINYVIENCGSYEINFGKDWWSFYKPYLVGIMKNWCKIQKTIKTISLDESIGDSNNEYTRYNFIASNNVMLPNIEEFIDEDNDNMYEWIVSAIEYGLKMDEIIAILSKKLGIKAEEVLKCIKDFMLSQNFVKENKNGTFQLAFKSEKSL